MAKKPEPPTFTLDDQQITAYIPRSVKKFIAVLDALAFGKLITPTRLADLAGYSIKHLRDHSTHPALAPYRHKVSLNSVYFANPQTIKAYQSHVEERNNA